MLKYTGTSGAPGSKTDLCTYCTLNNRHCVPSDI